MTVSAATTAWGFEPALGLTAPSHDTPDTPAPFHPLPERIEQEIHAAVSRRLSPRLGHWVERYAGVGRRDPYLWTWCRQAVEITTLPCVPEEVRDDLCDTKTLGVMWDVMLDDLADQNGNQELLEQLLLLPLGIRPDWDRFRDEDRAYGLFTQDIWDSIQQELRKLPHHAQYAELLRFDYLQLCNVMRYSYLLNPRPELLNLVEHDLYTPHNMHIMICSTIDLMASPTFDKRELGELRQIVWNAQFMGRIGNLVTTWERELGEADFTSGVFARAVACGHLSYENLAAPDSNVLRAAIVDGGHEAHYLQRWQKHRQFLLSRTSHFHSFDVRQLVAGFERLICLHLGSRGRK